MSNCLFTVEELDDFDKQWASKGWSNEAAKDFEEAQAKAVQEPPAFFKAEVAKVDIASSGNHGERHWWLAPLCLQREHMGGVVVRWNSDGGVKCGIFMFATQRPYIVGSLSATQVSSQTSSSSTSSFAQYVSSGRYVFKFVAGVGSTPTRRTGAQVPMSACCRLVASRAASSLAAIRSGSLCRPS